MQNTKMLLWSIVAFIILILHGLTYGGTTVMMPMRDSVHLATDIYLPPDTASGPVPVVLNRTPYGRGAGGVFQDSLFAHGIGWISQDTRGRGGSEGADSIFWDNGWGAKQDGYDAVEWLAAQPWCNGRVGIYGGSAHGITAYLCAGALPSHLVCGAVAHCASNLYKHGAFPGGCYRQEQLDLWYLLMGVRYMLDIIAEHYIYDDAWSTTNLEERYTVTNTPFYHVAGWYDTFCEGNIDAFMGLQYEGGSGAFGNQKIIIGPWCHGNWDQRKQGDLTYPENSLWDIVPTAVRWFAHYLKDEDNGIDAELPVRCYIMGDCEDTTAPGNEWIDFDSWPPTGIEYDTFFLYPDQSLSHEAPTVMDTGLTYEHDFDAPMLHNGGRNLWNKPGPKDQAGPYASPDLDTTRGKIWTSDVLSEAMTVTGRVQAIIYASSNCVDTDFMVRLCDVYPSGTSYLVFDGALQARFREGADHEVFMTPGQIYEFEIDLGNIAITFAPGHRIRVGVSSALYPRYAANPNTGEPFRQHTHTEIAHNTIHMGTTYPSCIILPVLTSLAIEETKALRTEKPELIINPNPFKSYCSILAPQNATVEVFDVAGRKITEIEGGKSVWIPKANVSSGLYFIRAKIGNTTLIKKVLYLK